MGNNKGNDIKRVNKEKGVANMLNYSTPGNTKPKAKKKTQSAYAGAGYVDEPKKNQQKEKYDVWRVSGFPNTYEIHR